MHLFPNVYLIQYTLILALYAQTIQSEMLETLKLPFQDLSDGCGGKIDAVIVTKKFEGKPLLARHRMVNAVLVNCHETKLV